MLTSFNLSYVETLLSSDKHVIILIEFVFEYIQKDGYNGKKKKKGYRYEHKCLVFTEIFKYTILLAQ